MPYVAEAKGPGDGTLTVRVIRDLNGNGAYDVATESNVAGIPVTVTDPGGATASGTTGPDGTVVVNLTGVTGGQYRVEAAIPDTMPGLKPAPAGGGLSSLTEFVTVADGANVNLTMGVWDPNDYCQANPDLVTCVLAKGDNTTTMGVTTFASQLGTTAPGGTVTQLSTSGQQGAVFGIGTDRSRNIYMGTYVKRHTEYGPAGAVNAIYRVNQSVPNAVSVFTTLPGTLTAHDPAGAVPYIADDVVYDRVGREGLGDVDVSADGKTLYAVNLNDSSLYSVPIQGTGDAVTAGAPTSVAIPRPATNCEGDWHPFGIGVRSTTVLVGGVCGAENTVTAAAPWGDPSKLRAHIYTFTGSGFTPTFDFPLDFQRGCAFHVSGTTACQPGTATAGEVLSANWEAWNSRVPATSPGGFSDFVSAPQPMLSNIEIDDAGNLVIGFRDRFADMQGSETQAYASTARMTGIAAGDVLRACISGSGYALESNGTCGGVTGALPGDNQGPGGGEFYDDNWTDGNFHDQTSTGGLAHLPGSDDVWTTRMDPFDYRPFNQGASQLDGNGSVLGRIEVHASPAGDPNFFGKANGLADLELLCDNAPVQLGNRVWFDTDGDGVQDGDEPPVAGVVVTLTPCAGGAALPPKTTDARGEYYFGTADGLTPDTCYNVKFDYSNVDTSTLPGVPPVARLKWTTKEAGPNRTIDSNVDTVGAAQVTVGPAGSVDHTIDAGLSITNRLGDLVWVDANGNGLQDVGELGVPGVRVTLTDSTGAQIATTTTDANGNYLFDGLLDGTYSVCFDLAALPGEYANYLATRPNAGDDAKDSDADPATGCTAPTELGPNKREDLTLDAGIRPPNRLGDYVWVDTNKNGLQDSGEAGVPGVTVVLRGSDGAQLSTTTTDADGRYLFDGLSDGSYSVCFDRGSLPAAVADYMLTAANAGDDATDSDADPATGCTEQVQLNVDSPEDLTLDAGLVAPVNRLGDYVWVDMNRNGLQDSGEPGVSGVTVVLKSGETEVARTTTDADGKYLFDGLSDGSYSVCFDVRALPAVVADYMVTALNAGDDALDSDADPATGCAEPVSLGVGNREDLTLDAGLVAPVNRLGDYVWVDMNRNGLQDNGEPGVPGVTIVLRGSDGAQLSTTTTDADGRYLFDELSDGSYSVCFELTGLPDQYADYLLTILDAGDDALDSDADPATGCAEPVSLGVGNRENLTLDAGLIAPVNRLGDYVWVDTNRNGLQDNGESGVLGVTVVLKSGEAEVARVTTDADGRYLFDELSDGSYSVCFELTGLPDQYADYLLTILDAGDDALDSDAGPSTGCTEPVTLGVGKRENLTLDAGIRAPNRLGDLVWVDTNRNGIQDSGETGVSGVTVTAKSSDGTVVGTTTTNADGRYLFDKLPDGSYSVCFDRGSLPAAVADYVLTVPNAGDDAAADSDADMATWCTPPVALSADHPEDLTLDAGLVSPVNRLGDLVWVDMNRNGLQDSGEPGVAGVTVVLTKGEGAQVARTTTNPDGRYLFDELSDGSYSVCLELSGLPDQYAGYLLTTPTAGDETADSNAGSATGCTESVTLGVRNRENLTLDAGIRPPNRLGSLVWVDTNRNGIQDSGEPGVPGMTVTVKTLDGTVAGTATTDPDGKYLFDRLPDGQFVVCFDRGTLPAPFSDYQLTAPNEVDDATDSDADMATWCTPPVTLSADHPENLTLGAGIVEPRNRIGDYVWIDRNHNGLQDEDEQPASNVPVVLLDKEGKKVAEMTTNKDGKYLFDNLSDGTYKVCFLTNLPADLAGYTLTKARVGEDGKNSVAAPETGCTREITVGPSNREILTFDAGLVPPASVVPPPGDNLANTGAYLGWWIAMAMLALGIGMFTMMASRRQSSSQSSPSTMEELFEQ